MSVTTEKTIGELAAESAAALQVFDRLGIDYCCGGGRTLEQACQAANVPIGQAVEALAAASRSEPAAEGARDWQSAPLSELLAHIQSTHHVYTREAMAWLGPLFDKVIAAHGENHPELLRLREIFSGLAGELTAHLMKEEMVLFPSMLRMAAAAAAGEPAPPSPFGSVRNPIAMMTAEHDGAGSALRSMRQIANGYTVPPDGCVSFQALYRGMAALEADLHRHIHLENNVLFPRAVAMERPR
jgi:regulator of cell morphogenesis and NO signaling